MATSDESLADDAQLFRHIIQDSDKTALQKSVNALQEWTQEWFLKLNASKCMVMSFGRNVEKSYSYNILENSQIIPLARTDQINDLGIQRIHLCLLLIFVYLITALIGLCIEFLELMMVKTWYF